MANWSRKDKFRGFRAGHGNPGFLSSLRVLGFQVGSTQIMFNWYQMRGMINWKMKTKQEAILSIHTMWS